MREILFRGKRIDNGEWVEGGYIRIDPPPVCFAEDKDKVGKPEHCIVIETGCADWGMLRHYGMCPVDPSTIGQYTGLEDQNGKKIFEGDIIKYTFDHPKDPTATENGLIERIGRVFFSKWRSSFSVTAGKNLSSSMNSDLHHYVRNGNRCVVIGNIYDMPSQKEPPPD